MNDIKTGTGMADESLPPVPGSEELPTTAKETQSGEDSDNHRYHYVAGQLGDAVGETGHAISSRARNDVGRLRMLFSLFSQGVVGFLLSLHLGATAVLSAVVFSDVFPYAYMYVLMGLLLWVVFAMRFQALRNGRRAAATRSLVVNLILAVFWTIILLEQIPSRSVVDGALRLRGDVNLLWVAIGMYLLAQAGMIIHGIQRRSKLD